jgi:hypothetical protein
MLPGPADAGSRGCPPSSETRWVFTRFSQVTTSRNTACVPGGQVVTGGAGSHVMASCKVATVPAGHVSVTGCAHGMDPHGPSAASVAVGSAGAAGAGVGAGVAASGAAVGTGGTRAGSGAKETARPCFWAGARCATGAGAPCAIASASTMRMRTPRTCQRLITVSSMAAVRTVAEAGSWAQGEHRVGEIPLLVLPLTADSPC